MSRLLCLSELEALYHDLKHRVNALDISIMVYMFTGVGGSRIINGMNISTLTQVFLLSPTQQLILEEADRQGQIRTLEATKDYQGTVVFVNGELFDIKENVALLYRVGE